jgi:excisionase family DNA binding protein
MIGAFNRRQCEAMSTHTQQVVSASERTARLMTVADAADFLAISRRQVYVLLERGELPAVRVGTRIRLIPAELTAYLEQHRAEAAP